MNNSLKKKKRQEIIDNPIEAISNLTSDFTQSAGQDLFSGMAKSAADQIFGTNSSSIGELSPNQELQMDTLNQNGIESNEILSYQSLRKNTERSVFSYQESEKVKQEISQLLKEIKLLIKSTRELTGEVEKAVMEQMPADPGTYHLNFYEWLILMIKSLRERVDESASWLRMFKSKKKQKQYWNMYKKHGTSFGLSSERNIATQVG